MKPCALYGTTLRIQKSSTPIEPLVAERADVTGEGLPLVGELVQERGGLPVVAAELLLVIEHAVAERLEPDRKVGPEHRATPVDRPAVAIHPDHVDVARPQGDLLLDDVGALVHHRVEQALEDLLVEDGAARDAELGRDTDDDLLDVGVGSGGTVGAILVVAGACLLAEAAHLAEAVRDGRFLATPLADAPAHVEPGEVAHRAAPSGSRSRRGPCRPRAAAH